MKLKRRSTYKKVCRKIGYTKEEAKKLVYSEEGQAIGLRKAYRCTHHKKEQKEIWHVSSQTKGE